MTREKTDDNPSTSLRVIAATKSKSHRRWRGKQILRQARLRRAGSG